jgi:predicted nucleic acid-binding Zn ribbon protein
MIHKAEAAEQFKDDAVSVCVHCHREIKKVLGGEGAIWVHADGYVVGRNDQITPASSGQKARREGR